MRPRARCALARPVRGSSPLAAPLGARRPRRGGSHTARCASVMPVQLGSIGAASPGQVVGLVHAQRRRSVKASHLIVVEHGDHLRDPQVALRRVPRSVFRCGMVVVVSCEGVGCARACVKGCRGAVVPRNRAAPPAELVSRSCSWEKNSCSSSGFSKHSGPSRSPEKKGCCTPPIVMACSVAVGRPPRGGALTERSSRFSRSASVCSVCRMSRSSCLASLLAGLG